MRRLSFLILFALLLSAGAALYGEESNSPKREFRGAWIHIVGNRKIATLTTEEAKRLFLDVIDSCYLAGCNAIIFQVRPAADAFYHSEIEPWTRYLTGVQGKAPEPYWDPLQFAIEECHKRGMELHAWCNPYRVTLEQEDSLCSDHLYYKNPSIFVKYGKQLFFNPGEPLAREHTIKVITDIVARYDVDAIHFDDYFYPYPVRGEEFDDQATFEKYGPQQGFVGPGRKADWRRNNVTMLIKELSKAIKEVKPWVRFGISPFGVHRNKKDTPDGSGSDTDAFSNYEQLFADVPLWVERGYIDYNAPQIYWKIGHPKADYQVVIKWWNDNAKRGQLYVGQNISTFSEKDLQNPATTQMARKMELVRELPNVDGNVWWPGWSIEKNACNIADSLILKYQKYRALIPAYTEIDSLSPEALEHIERDGNLIRWRQSRSQAADPMQKALFYVVYRFPEGVKADIGRAEYIVKITNGTEYNVVEENNGNGEGCRYVVTVVDRCWNESEPSAIIGYEGQQKRYSDHYYERMARFEAESPICNKDIVFLGNSLTEGGNWSEYFSTTEKRLNKKGGAIRNRGIIGDTAEGISERLDEITKGAPKKIFLLCGVNDISHNLTSGEIVKRIEELIVKIKRDSPKTKLYLQSLLPFNESFKRYKNLTGKSGMVSEINVELERLARLHKIKFLNIYPLFLENGEAVLSPSITPDGLHLDKEGYRIWRDAIEKYVK